MCRCWPVVVIDAAHLDAVVRPANDSWTASPPVGPDEEAPLAARVERFERDLIRATVARHGGNWAAAARALGVHRSNLHHRARRLGLKAAPG